MVAEQNLLLHIRQATKALHEQLDSCYPFITMQSSEINPNSYRTMLEILYFWHQKVSPHLSVSSEFLRLGETNFLCCRND
ncbi:biliverdin-producing heme oxygenase [Pseudoalteromonas sp. GB56]